MKQIFGVVIPNADGGESVLALFSTPVGANLYVETIVQRQAYTPNWQRQNPVRSADAVPPMAGRAMRTASFLLDAPLEDLPGAWTAVVNRGGRLVDYWFSFDVAPSTPGHMDSSGTGAIAIGHAATPCEAFHKARTYLYPRPAVVPRSHREPFAAEDLRNADGTLVNTANDEAPATARTATMAAPGCRVRSLS